MRRPPGGCATTPELSAAVLALGSALVARRGVVGEREAACFRIVNRAGDAWYPVAWPVMQAGSLGASFVVAEAVRRRRGNGPAAVVLATGVGVWIGIKVVKPLVGRPRPHHLLDGVVVRGADPSGLGYPSGHAAVSVALATTATSGVASLPALAGAGAVGIARVYTGAHLPLDVVGGWAMGLLAGRAVRRLSRVRRRRASAARRCRPGAR